MKTNQLIEQIDALKDIFEKYENHSSMSAIERDLALAKLRNIYDSLLDLRHATESAKGSAFSENETLHESRPVKKEQADYTNDGDHENESAMGADSDETREEIFGEEGSQEVIAVQNSLEMSAEKTEEENILGKPESAFGQGAERIFGQDVKQVLEQDAKQPFGQDEIEAISEQGQSELESEIEKCEEKPCDTSQKPCETSDKTFEVTEKPCETSDKTCDADEEQELFGQQVSKSLVAEFVKELFWRDEQFFVDEISKLGNLPDFDSALIYISEKYNWRADSQAAQKFTEILSNHNFGG